MASWQDWGVDTGVDSEIPPQPAKDVHTPDITMGVQPCL